MRENRYVDGRDFAFDLRYFGTNDELERVVADVLCASSADSTSLARPREPSHSA